MGFKLDPWALGPIIRFIISGSFSSSAYRAKQRLKATMPSRKKASKKHATISKASFVPPQEQDYYEEERLASLLKSVRREIESARLRDGNSSPEKIWFKEQFSIGVNDVTRVLERMPPIAQVRSSPQQPHSIYSNHKAPLEQLQAKGNAINQLFEKILRGDEINHGTNCINTIAMPDAPCQWHVR